MYQILSQSVGCCRLYIKKTFGVFIGSQCILALRRKMQSIVNIRQYTIDRL